MRFWRRYKYKNFTFLFLSLLLAIFLFRNETFHSYLLHLNGLGYIGAFLAGVLFVSTFTIASGAIILLVLAEEMSHIGIGIVAGLGAVLGDYIMFRFIRNNDLVNEMKHLFDFFQSEKLSHLIHTKYFSWTLPVIGALIIASPLPDELGVSLMGISKMKPSQFLLTSFLLNAIGIFLVVSASRVIKP